MGNASSRPATAPGPSQEELDQERELRQQLERTVEDLQSQLQRVELGEADAAARARVLEEEAARQRLALELALEEIRKKEEDLRNYPVPAYLDYGPGDVNIGVTGASGVGKSSLINALRRMKKGEAGYAKTGNVETTMKPEKYTFPAPTGILTSFRQWACDAWASRSSSSNDDHSIQVGDHVLLRGIAGYDGEQVEILRKNGDVLTVKLKSDSSCFDVPKANVVGKLAKCNLWDLPGTGTPKFPQKTYLQRMGIRHYDLVLLVTATRFTEPEELLVKELREWNVPFFLVRNKVDEAIKSAEEDALEVDPDASVDSIADQVCEEIRAYFETLNLSPIYLISTKPAYRSKYDFTGLEHDMMMAVKGQRGVNVERQCPVCHATYADYNGEAGSRSEDPRGGTCCSTCLRMLHQCEQ